MLVSRSLQSLGPVSLHPEAKRDHPGPLFKCLEHSEHAMSLWTEQPASWPGVVSRTWPISQCLVCLSVCPVCCSPWLWCPVLGTEAAESPTEMPSPGKGAFWCVGKGADPIRVLSSLWPPSSGLAFLGPRDSPVLLTGPDAWPNAGAQGAFAE